MEPPPAFNWKASGMTVRCILPIRHQTIPSHAADSGSRRESGSIQHWSEPVLPTCRDTPAPP